MSGQAPLTGQKGFQIDDGTFILRQDYGTLANVGYLWVKTTSSTPLKKREVYFLRTNQDGANKKKFKRPGTLNNPVAVHFYKETVSHPSVKEFCDWVKSQDDLKDFTIVDSTSVEDASGSGTCPK